jgi:two-component system LytT family response regulator
MSTHYVKTEHDLIRTVIVDDERLARDAIRMRLKDEPDVELLGEAATGREAVKLIADALPDVVFLDVQMPGMDGFEVLDRVAPTWLPIVVFVTAYDRYALKAFETHALDYLLKPFTRDRFKAALDRARAAFANASEPSAQRGLVKLLNDRSGSDSDRGKGYLVRFAVRQHHGMRLVRVRDIDYIQAAGNYAEIHAGGGTHLVRMTMQELEERLDPAMFVRIHRSTIVKIDRIRNIVADSHGDFDLSLHDGTVLRLSRNYRTRLQQ